MGFAFLDVTLGGKELEITLTYCQQTHNSSTRMFTKVIHIAKRTFSSTFDVKNIIKSISKCRHTWIICLGWFQILKNMKCVQVMMFVSFWILGILKWNIYMMILCYFWRQRLNVAWKRLFFKVFWNFINKYIQYVDNILNILHTYWTCLI